MKKKLIIIALLLVGIAINSEASEQRRIVIKGVVVDADSNLVQGASIFIDGVEMPVVTRRKGEFRLRISANADTIIAVKPDKGMAEVVIGDKREFRLVLDTVKILALMSQGYGDEHIESGYGSVIRKYSTGSSGTIDGRTARFQAYNNIYDMIKGELPGVQVHGTSITIRGTGSMTASTQPLFVVDGVVFETIANIPPSQVRSIDVLKDAQASIYGSRGANGVIIIRLRDRIDQ